MMSTIVNFPSPEKGSSKTVKKVRCVDGVKYFNEKQIRLLRRTVRDKAEAKGIITAIREWMVIDLLTQTGLRVSEAANLRCGDLRTGYGQSAIFVREGKGSLSGTVQIPEALKRHLKWFLKWKEERGEGIGPDDHLFIGQRGPWTSQAIQQVVKGYLKALGLYESGKSAHALRHSYAVQLYAQKRDLRTVQKQLRHRSVRSTQVYADVTEEQVRDQVQHLWR